MTAILGFSAFYHDSAATIIIDGKIIAAAQEERFTRKKHDNNFPTNAINFVLKFANIKISENLTNLANEKKFFSIFLILTIFCITWIFSDMLL